MKTLFKTLVITGVAFASLLAAAPQAQAVEDLQIAAPDSVIAGDADSVVVSSAPVLTDPSPIQEDPNQVPEPATLTLAALGGASLMLLRRRK